jgi:hypothetical protein
MNSINFFPTYSWAIKNGFVTAKLNLLMNLGSEIPVRKMFSKNSAINI